MPEQLQPVPPTLLQLLLLLPQVLWPLLLQSELLLLRDARLLAVPFLKRNVVFDTLPVGGRIRHYASTWEKLLQVQQWHSNILYHGLSWHWTSFPPSTTNLRFLRLDEIQALVDKQALVPADPTTPGFYSGMFVVPKKTGGFRPVIDLKRLNQSIRCPTFRMETPQSIRKELLQGEFTTSIDLADAYLHVPIAPSFQRFLRVAVNGRVWQFQAMPFGLNIAPRTFTMLLTPVAAHLRYLGIRLHRYLDDWLIRGDPPAEVILHSNLVLSLFHRLGLLIWWEKSDLTPRQVFTFLGVQFDLSQGTVAPPPEKAQKLIALVQQVLASHLISVRRLLQLIGLLNHVADYIPLGRLHLRPVQFYLNAWVKDLREEIESLIPVRPSLRLALLPWVDSRWLHSQVPLRNHPPTLTLATDASLVGWGAHCDDQLLSGRWSKTERRLHISVLELRAVRLALQALGPTIYGQSIRVMMDSVVAAAYIRRQGGTRSLSLYQEARDLLLWCSSHSILVSPHYLPGHLNVLADLQSRPDQVLSSEWTLHPAVFRRLQSHFPGMEIDLFATRLNHQLPRFVSPFPDPLAEDSDALSLEWAGLNAYAFPPFTVIPEVLK